MAVRHDRKVSILDVMGPVMVGPSSSHTAGTARLGRVAREVLDEDPVEGRVHLHPPRGPARLGGGAREIRDEDPVELHFPLPPPLAATYRGHGSDFALVGGAIGL